MGLATETVQFNTRMERSLKQDGDAALKSAGYTPSEAVRALWYKAVKRAENPRAIVDLLEDGPLPARPDADARDPLKLEALRRGRRSCASALERMGVDRNALPSFAFDAYDELMEGFALERHGTGDAL